jgi:type I restriction enzyme S subunit
MLLSQGHVFEERPRGRWISRHSVTDYRDYMAPDGVTLVAAQGTMGDSEVFGHCQFSHRNFDNCMITEHILRIVPNSSIVNPGYLFAFLSSEYGFHLFRSTARGTKLLGFILGLVARMPIPMVAESFQNEIGKSVYQAYDNRADALALEDQAQVLLVKALGIQAS